MSESANTHFAASCSVPSDLIFIDELASLLRTSRSTIERQRRDGSFPFPEVSRIDKRPRWSRRAVEAALHENRRGRRRR